MLQGIAKDNTGENKQRNNIPVKCKSTSHCCGILFSFVYLFGFFLVYFFTFGSSLCFCCCLGFLVGWFSLVYFVALFCRGILFVCLWLVLLLFFSGGVRRRSGTWTKNKASMSVEVEWSGFYGFLELAKRFKEKLIQCSKHSR